MFSKCSLLSVMEKNDFVLKMFSFYGKNDFVLKMFSFFGKREHSKNKVNLCLIEINFALLHSNTITAIS